jgi:hypothetical protein
MNRLPIDPQWAAKVDSSIEQMAYDLECMLLALAIQTGPGGKTVVTVANVPDNSVWSDLAKTPAEMFRTVALMIDHIEKNKTTQ